MLVELVNKQSGSSVVVAETKHGEKKIAKMTKFFKNFMAPDVVDALISAKTMTVTTK